MSDPLILITNDDGIHATGIQVLAEAMRPLGDAWIVAPDREQSASSHSVSLHRPLRVTEVAPQSLMVDGTPVDSVMLATRHLLPRRPDLVVSGINRGANLGDDVTYSGTVAGAREGMLLGIPSVAVSNVSDSPQYWDTAARVAVSVCKYVLANGLPKETLLNVNTPDVAFEALPGCRWTRMGRRHYEDEVFLREDPRGNSYYWIGGTLPDEQSHPDSDVTAIDEGFVSVTPLLRDATHEGSMEILRSWKFDLE